MNVAEQAERLMREHLGVVPPWDRPWKLRAFEYILAHLPQIQAFRDQGLALISEPQRIKLIKTYIGEQEGHEHTDYNFNVWLLNECIGERIMSHDDIFMTCLVCHKPRTGAGMSRGLCRCGGQRMSNCVAPLDTRKAMAYLAMGY
jgi:hypothetical protein